MHTPAGSHGDAHRLVHVAHTYTHTHLQTHTHTHIHTTCKPCCTHHNVGTLNDFVFVCFRATPWRQAATRKRLASCFPVQLDAARISKIVNETILTVESQRETERGHQQNHTDNGVPENHQRNNTNSGAPETEKERARSSTKPH